MLVQLRTGRGIGIGFTSELVRVGIFQRRFFGTKPEPRLELVAAYVRGIFYEVTPHFSLSKNLGEELCACAKKLGVDEFRRSRMVAVGTASSGKRDNSSANRAGRARQKR